jgi:pyruvate dehydrogenase E2 component (dihydrolipoamide acetyltransferase)
LVSVETDKAVVEVPSPHSGYVKRLLGKLGERLKVGAPLIEFDEARHADAGTVVGELGVQPSAAAAPAFEGSARATPEVSPIAAGPAHARGGTSPAVRTLAHQLGVDLTGLRGSGPDGLITRTDVEHAAADKDKGPSGEPAPLRGVRRSMAINMTKSHAEVVPATVWDEADIEPWWSEHVDVTVRLVRSIAAACAAIPLLNSWYDSAAETLQTFLHVDLGIAVDLEGGLIVPVLRDVAQQDAAALRRNLDTLKAAVRTRSVAVADLRGPTITLSNYGMFIGRLAALVVLPPQVAIIGAGRITLQAVPQGKALAFNHRLPLSLTFDHRVVTGGEAARFLKVAIDDLEQRD